MFKFRLAPLLRYRKRQEDEKMREMAVINKEFVDTERLIARFETERQENARKMSELSAEAHDVSMRRMYEEFLNRRDSEIRAKRAEADMISDRLEKKRRELVDYVRRRRSLEVYRDRLEERYDKEQARLDRIQSDEVAGQLYFRRAAI